MNLKETIKLAWDNRHQIADGLWNTYIANKPEIEKEAIRRKSICESNVCGWYDPSGKAETSAIPGKPTCSLCHCNIEIKIHAMHIDCALKEKLSQTPLWEAIMTEEQAKEIGDVAYKKQFEKK